MFIKDAKIAADLNIFFLNAVKKLKILEYAKNNPFTEKLSHPILKAISKYVKHQSIVTINDVTNGWTFQFSWLIVDDLKSVQNGLVDFKYFLLIDS